MSQRSETLVPIQDRPQKWWCIVCTYDGRPGCIAASVGNTAEEAKATFLGSLAEPHLAVIEELSLIGCCKVIDALEKL